MLEELNKARRVVGVKQIRKLLPTGQVRKVFLAQDADPMLLEPLEALCMDCRTPEECLPRIDSFIAEIRQKRT